MNLHKLTDRVYYSDYEEERDRPTLGYIRGNNFSVAIDAGHSKEHLDEFYELLNNNHLPLPSLTIITHWHWDHSFAMHAVNGLTVANKKTNDYLKEFIRNRNPVKDEEFKNMHSSIALEYAQNKPIVVVTADIVYENQMTVDAGGIILNIFEAPSPHTDDSSLIYLPQEKVLFFGDALSGEFPIWIADRKKNKEFTDVIRGTDAKYLIGGHWDIFTKEELISELENYEPLK